MHQHRDLAICIRVTPCSSVISEFTRLGRAENLAWQTRHRGHSARETPRLFGICLTVSQRPGFSTGSMQRECGRELWIRHRDRMQVRVCSPLSPDAGHWFAPVFIPSTLPRIFRYNTFVLLRGVILKIIIDYWREFFFFFNSIFHNFDEKYSRKIIVPRQR